MNSNLVKEFTERATTGLEADAELRLDVQAELATHVEAMLADAEGASDEEIAECVRHLGTPEELAGALLEGNMKRLKFRAVARVLTYWLLVPLALLSSLFIFFGSVFQGRNTEMAGLLGIGDGVAEKSLFGLIDRPSFSHRLTADEQLILRGGAGSTQAENQKAILDRWPDNPVYLGNYISHLCAEADDNLEILEPALAAARQADPDNARYGLILAAAKLKGTTKSAWDDDDVEQLEITDRERFDLAMDEMLTALEKPAYRRYAREMLAERLKILGPPKSFMETIQRTAIAAGVLLPDLHSMRTLSRYSTHYAMLLAQEENEVAARQFAAAWEKLGRHILSDSFTLIDVLVAGAIINSGNESAEALSRLGDEAGAEAMRAEASKWSAPIESWKAGKDKLNEQIGKTLVERGSIMDGLLLPALGEPVSLDELRGNRMVEYSLVDQVYIGQLVVVCTLIMIGCWLIGLCWRLGSGGHFQAIVLLPRLEDYVRIIGIGMLLPLGVYAILTIIPLTGGREWGFRINGMHMLAQIACASVGVLLLTSHLARRNARARCEFLQIAAPPATAMSRKIDKVVLGIMILAVILAFAPMFGSGDLSRSIIPSLSLVATSLCVCIRCGFLLVSLPRWLTSRQFGNYFGTMARSVVPVYAVFIILLSWVALPTLRQVEKYWVGQASYGGKAGEGFSLIEDRLTQRLIEELRASVHGS